MARAKRTHFAPVGGVAACGETRMLSSTAVKKLVTCGRCLRAPAMRSLVVEDYTRLSGNGQVVLEAMARVVREARFTSTFSRSRLDDAIDALDAIAVPAALRRYVESARAGGGR